MTLRHYGRALAAASGAVLLCATLSGPALATEGVGSFVYEVQSSITKESAQQ